MDHLSAPRQRLWEAMESCRSGSDDLSDPQFADLAARLAEDPELRGQFQRVQQADVAIKAALANVPVPAGLADRLSRRLAEAAPAAIPGSGSAVDSPVASRLTAPAVAVPDSPAPRRAETERFSWRRLLVGFAAISAAAALLFAVWTHTHQPQQYTPASVLDEAMGFFDQDNKLVGELVVQVAPPVEYPMSRDIGRLRGVRWRHVEKFLGGPAVAYDLPRIPGRATLYVVRRNVPGLPAMAPPSPKSNTGGKSAAAWQTSDSLYVLVVEGDAETYRRYLDQSLGPLT
jgi:hypothetical protein